MSWSIGFDSSCNRDIGYGVPAYCDSPKCSKKIDRGLAYVCCDQKPYGGEKGCGLYFCENHQDIRGRCSRCRNYRTPYKAKPDHPEWAHWKLTHDSWAKWRAEEPDKVLALENILCEARATGWTPKEPEP